MSRELNFFDRNANHTSACFETKGSLVIIDCPMSTTDQLKNVDLSKYNNIYVLITHTHGDHSGGLGLLVQNCTFKKKKKIHIIAPSAEVKTDIETVLKIEGCEPSWYNIYASADLKEDFFIQSIPTRHVPQLEGKCFGYELDVNGVHTIYTGDTSTLEPFVLRLQNNSKLYVDMSMHYDTVHLNFEEAKPQLMDFVQKGVTVNLMHLDDEQSARRAITGLNGIQLAPLIAKNKLIYRQSR